MKIKKITIFALAVFLLALTSGCKSTPQSPPVQPPENTQQEANLKSGEITDPIELEKLWQEYFYDSITTVGNTREFDSAEEIDPLNVAGFCWLKYITEHGLESLPLAEEGSSQRLFPLDTALQYARRYFDLTAIDVSDIEEHSYDPKKKAFLFGFGTEQDRPSYTSGNAWGIHLDKVTRNNDGTVTAMLVRYDQPGTDRIELTQTFTLKQREDGSLYFAGGRWDYVDNDLVSLTGDYRRFDKISGFAGNMEELSMAGETDGMLILAYTPYEKGKKCALMLVDPDTMTIKKSLDVDGSFGPTDVSMKGENIAIRLNDRVVVVDKTLSHSDDISLPAAISEKIKREPKYNANGIPDIFFGGYDVTCDWARFVYADEEGLKLYNTADSTEKLLSRTVTIEGSKLMDRSYHRSPRFIAGETKVITTMTAYEGTMGYTVCNLESGTEKTYHISSEGSSTGYIRYDNGLMEINTYIYNEEKQTGDYKTVYFNFRTEDVKEITLQDPGSTGEIRTPETCYVGRDHAAFTTYTWDENDHADSMFYLNRINLKTLTVEPSVISVKAADTRILGVMADGRVVFWYNLNPSENGVCITK